MGEIIKMNALHCQIYISKLSAFFYWQKKYHHHFSLLPINKTINLIKDLNFKPPTLWVLNEKGFKKVLPSVKVQSGRKVPLTLSNAKTLSQTSTILLTKMLKSVCSFMVSILFDSIFKVFDFTLIAAYQTMKDNAVYNSIFL